MHPNYFFQMDEKQLQRRKDFLLLLHRLSQNLCLNKINIHTIKINEDTKCWWCKNSFNTPNITLPEQYFDGTFYCIGNFCSYNCAKAYNLDLNDNNICCFWCCHNIDTNMKFGMPYNYDTINDTFYIIGSFCSLQCANAYNFSINCGSDKVWEINSWIQMIAKRCGFTKNIRPAPSKYLLKMFGGNLSIDEFREAHLNNDKTYILNIPPMISISSTTEILNTSYLNKISGNESK